MSSSSNMSISPARSSASTTTAENVASAINTTPFGRLQPLPEVIEEVPDVEHPAPAVELREQYERPTSPSMTSEDWDASYEEAMRAHIAKGKRVPAKVYKDTTEPAKIMQGRATTEECDPNDFPSVLFPLEGGGMADIALQAEDLLAIDDERFKNILDKCEEGHQRLPMPTCITVKEKQQMDRVIERMERVYGRWPGAFIFMVDERMIKEAPKYNPPGKVLEDYRLQPPTMHSLFDMTSNIQAQYDELKTGEMFKKVYTTLVLFSDYEFAFIYCRILITRYYDVTFHLAQMLVNIMHTYPDYLDVESHYLLVYDVAARLIQMGGDKYFDEVTRMVTSGLYAKPSLKVVPKAEHGLLQPSPKALDRVRLEELIEGLRFYLMTLSNDGKKISLDAAYNLASYAHQLIFKLDEMKEFKDDYVLQCVNIIEHRHTIHGIDCPQGITATWREGNPKNLEIDGAVYRLT